MEPDPGTVAVMAAPVGRTRVRDKTVAHDTRRRDGVRIANTDGRMR